MTKSRRPKGTHASGSTAGIKDGRQQVISKREGGTPQQRNPQTKITTLSQQSSAQKWKSMI
jgi:hypothetical protein